jgi:hypothetical protein
MVFRHIFAIFNALIQVLGSSFFSVWLPVWRFRLSFLARWERRSMQSIGRRQVVGANTSGDVAGA